MDDLWLGVAVIAAGVFATAGAGAALSGDGAASWYRAHKPGWAPPLRASGPVWLLQLALLASATCLVWVEYGTWEFGYLVPFIVLTALSAAWPVVLFGKRHPGRATLLGTVLTLVAAWVAWRFAADVAYAAGLTAAFAGGAALTLAVNAALWWRARDGA